MSLARCFDESVSCVNRGPVTIENLQAGVHGVPVSGAALSRPLDIGKELGRFLRGTNKPDRGTWPKQNADRTGKGLDVHETSSLWKENIYFSGSVRKSSTSQLYQLGVMTRFHGDQERVPCRSQFFPVVHWPPVHQQIAGLLGVGHDMGNCSKNDADRFVELVFGHSEASRKQTLSSCVPQRGSADAVPNPGAHAGFAGRTAKKWRLPFRSERRNSIILQSPRLDDCPSEQHDRTNQDEKQTKPVLTKT